MEADKFYTEVWPDYMQRQMADIWWYERLWSVLLDRLGKPRGGLLVDWGSGPGLLLNLAQRRGWSVWGIEPSPSARAMADSIGIGSSHPDAIADWHSTKADAIISTETLEHVQDPAAELRKMASILTSGGLIAISVPNDNNPLQRLFWGKSKPWVHHTHLSYFNPRSLREKVEQAGFEVVWQRTSFPVELLLVLPIRRKLAWKLSRLWPAPPLLWRFGIGRHCLMIARKV